MQEIHEQDRTDWPVVWITVLGGVAAALHVGKVPPALPQIRAELALGLVAGGFVISLFNALGMSLGVLMGSLADRVGRARLVVAGFSCLAAGGALGALSQGAGPLMFSRFLEGVGFIAISVALPAVIAAASAARDRPLALGMWSVYTPTGMSLALVAAPAVLGAAGWRALWWGIAALAIAAGLAVRLAMRRVRLPAPPRGRPLPVLLETVTRRGLLLIALAFGAYAFQWVTLMVWLPTFLAEELATAPAQAAFATAAVVVANVPGITLGGWLMRRGVGAHALVMTGSAVMGLAALGIFQPWLEAGPRLALCLVFSFCGGFLPVSLFSSVPAQSPTPAHLGAANGMLVQGSALGQFIGAPLIAAAVSAAGGSWSGATAPMIAAACIAALAGYLAARR